jgi:hypothetical protein
LAVDGGFLLESGDVGLLGLKRSVDGVVTQVQVERPVLVGPDEIAGFIGQAVGQILPFEPWLERRDRRAFVEIGVEVAAGVPDIGAARIGVKALAGRQELVGPEVPFADMSRGIAGLSTSAVVTSRPMNRALPGSSA